MGRPRSRWRHRAGLVGLVAGAALAAATLVPAGGPADARSDVRRTWPQAPQYAHRLGLPGAPPSLGASALGADGRPLALVYTDDFDRLSYRWTRYRGRPGGDPKGWWEPSHVTVSGGALVLTGSTENGRWTSGGVKLEHGLAPLRYGRAEVRFRAEKGPYAFAIMVWPADNSWPPEIDFAEDNGGDRSMVTATLHTGTRAAHGQVRRTVTADFSQWHTVGVAWSPGRIEYSLDGQVWGLVSDAGVPSAGMRLVIQQQAWACDPRTWYTVCPRAGEPPNRLYVDWVKVWSR